MVIGSILIIFDITGWYLAGLVSGTWQRAHRYLAAGGEPTPSEHSPDCRVG